jgi:hypothetical protein
LVVCELLKTVSLLKSEKTKDKTKLKKLITTKKNCKNVNDKIFVFNILELLKFLTEKKIKIKLKHKPKINE